MPSNQTDTIAAIATPPGVGGIGVIRVSGPHALALADKVFRTPSGASLCDAPSHTIHYGPHCRTDRQCGGRSDGGRNARAAHLYGRGCDGAFTHARPPSCKRRRAAFSCRARWRSGGIYKTCVLNRTGRPCAGEAVLDVIHADSDASIKNAVSQLEGGLSRQIEQIRAPLLYTAAQFAAAVDYPDDEIADLSEAGAARYADGGGFRVRYAACRCGQRAYCKGRAAVHSCRQAKRRKIVAAQCSHTVSACNRDRGCRHNARRNRGKYQY